MVAQSTAVQVYNVNKSKQPKHHHERLFDNNQTNLYPTRSTDDPRLEFHLSLARVGFFYQGSIILSALPENVKTAGNASELKKIRKSWIVISNFHNNTPVNNSNAPSHYQYRDK